MIKITERLKECKVLVSDGAWGTFLQAKGLKAGECPELWNADHKNDVLEIAKSYVNAGADMIETNSFGGSSIKLRSYGLDSRTTELNRAAAEISREAAGNKVYVLGSIGPTGKMLIMGDVTERELYDSFKEQAIALEKGGADAILIETLSCIDEAIIAVKASKENTSIEVICTMTFSKSPENNFFTMMGVTPADMTNKLIEAGAVIIGANCGNGGEIMIPIVKEIRAVNQSVPILVHSNAGMPIYENGKTVFPETPEETASFIPGLIKAGVNIVGGCCGTTPDHIQAIKNCLNKDKR